MSKEYNSALQARVEQFLKEKNISQAKAAPLMGISQTALSQYRRRNEYVLHGENTFGVSRRAD